MLKPLSIKINCLVNELDHTPKLLWLNVTSLTMDYKVYLDGDNKIRKSIKSNVDKELDKRIWGGLGGKVNGKINSGIRDKSLRYLVQYVK